MLRKQGLKPAASLLPDLPIRSPALVHPRYAETGVTSPWPIK